MQPIEALSQYDKNMISSYIDHYGYTSDSESASSERKASIEHLLRIWDNEKEQLFHAFGDKLIVSRQFSYSMPEAELANLFDKELSDPESACATFERCIRQMCPAGHNEPLCRCYGDEARILLECFNDYSLATNKFDSTFNFPMPDGKTLKIEEGAKIVKVLGKIAKAYGFMEEYENFRLKHSLILNQKKLTGEFCLSIHPLDYMTMSDNDCDWCSCMSWMDSGCYRRGTVECMNSPLVVVGYLKAKNDMCFGGKDTYSWNNKKWRSLFLVHPSVITSVKGYPYHNPEFSMLGVQMLQEMMNNPVFCEPFAYSYDGGFVRRKDAKADDSSFRVTFDASGDMYNDFGCQTHYGTFILDHFDNGDMNYIDYSGRTMCIHCGSILGEVDFPSEEEELCCASCAYGARCAGCGEAMHNGETRYILDDEYYCEDCYYDNQAYCAFGTDEGHKDNMCKIYVLDEGEVFQPDETYSYSYFYVRHHFINYSTDAFAKYNEPIIPYTALFYCGADALEHHSRFWSTDFYVYRNMMTGEGIKHFANYIETP